MTFPRYPDYKSSGQDWIGDMPVHWHMYRSKNVFSERNIKALESDEQLTASQKYGVIPQKLFSQLEDQKVMQVILGRDILKKAEVNDFVISMRSFQGGLEFCSYSGAVSSAYVPLYANRELDNRFFKHLFKSVSFISALQNTSNLVRDGQALRYNNFAQLSLPFPSLKEQRTIGAFLDHETARIDALIAEQQRLIDLLKEKRQAVISTAVTKGLDPTVPMKDSGVKWLGEVPAHWDVVPLKHVVSTPITDGPHETPEFIDDGVLFISAEAVSTGRINFEKARYISREDHARYSKKYLPKKFDIYMVKSGATTGVTAIVETDDEFNIWSPLAALRCKSDYVPYFVFYSMRSYSFQESVVISWSFGTQQNIGMGVIGNLPITQPPLDEQAAIADYIARQLDRWDRLIAEGVRSVELLQERRSALISAAVTGKIDVRGWQPPAGTQAPELAVAEAL
ncbi:restriction endonuclease subunit S [Pseudomonas aeruginosa]|nr:MULTISPECIES: restriction endonuclease subunit S [Pseudomonas]EKU7802676.1 restriction endonuclease subunit S [Pseudomonas aeruginosa]EKV3149142.1 restriction endonuclease subunit S [Pseudomonas aeruginosa]EKV6521542.1 restriction endonuclease subunit S [Pseudomonas aeruginosa]EKW5131915.1 restriction endonuclease subunit S [Pseudomonas aeruginosa]EKX4695393.1 restriction endonuclease subunit S [Pseudomonas aeruginosa]